MAGLRELIDLAKRRIEDNPALASEIGAVYKFVLDGDGGGTFVLNLKENPGVSETDGPADCTIRMTLPDFLQIVESRADARQYFFGGKVRVDGNLLLATRLRRLSDLFR